MTSRLKADSDRDGQDEQDKYRKHSIGFNSSLSCPSLLIYCLSLNLLSILLETLNLRFASSEMISMENISLTDLKVYKRRAAVLVAFLLLVALTFSLNPGSREHNSAQAAAKTARRVIVISLDGLDARYLQKRDEYRLRIPSLRRLMNEGVTAGVLGVYPSVTYPSHTTLVTGANPIVHGVYGNEVFEPPDAPQTRRWQWFANQIKAETLWDAARRRGLKTGLISWPVAGGAGDYNFPEIWKPGGTQEESFAVINANTRPAGLVQEVKRRDPELLRNVTKDETDDMRTRVAEYIIAEKKPEMVLIHLFDLDHFEHNYGPFTPEAFAMLEKVDGYVGRIVASAERAGTLSDTAIFIVSDHGFLPATKLIHPGVLLARAGLVKINQDSSMPEVSIASDWRAGVLPTGGSCSIILRDPKDYDAVKKALAMFKSYRGEQGSGAEGQPLFDMLDRKTVLSKGANPRAVLMLEAKEGYSFGGNYTGEVVTENKQRGTHGYLPTRYETSFIASGAGIGQRGVMSRISMLEIGPTIARSLDLSLRNAQRRGLSLR